MSFTGRANIFSAGPAGTFVGQAGSGLSPVFTGDHFEMTERFGIKTVFRPDGRVDFLASPDGGVIAISYNAAGKIAEVPPQTGPVTDLPTPLRTIS